MRFGVSLYPFTRYPDAAAIHDTAELADSLGFETVTIGEHVVVPNAQLGVLPTKWYDSLVLGATIAARTKRIKIFFSVLVLPYYHPVKLAKAISSLDVLSGGRVIVGVGAGWLKEEFDMLGVPFAERGARTDEVIRAMKELWTADKPSFKGRWVSFDEVTFDPRPLTKPHPPIWVGGWGDNALRRAVALGDGLYPATHGPLGAIVTRMERARELLAKAGRDPAKFTFAHAIDYGGTTESKYSASPIAGEHLAFSVNDPDSILRHVEEAGRAGVWQISVRFPGRDHREIMDHMRRFHAEVILKSLG